MKRTTKLVCMALTLVATMMPLASAHDTTVDPDDSLGPLDTVYTRLRKPEGSSVIRAKLVTYEKWENAVLARTQSNERRFISFEFDTREDEESERRVVVTTRDGVLTASMYGPGIGDPLDAPIAGVGVRRPDEHSVAVSFPARLLGRGSMGLNWSTATSFEDEGDENCPKPDGPYDGGFGVCVDFTETKRFRQ